jgi:nitrite reductase/ring-hydroxylating ferredoxin subunit
MSDGAVCNNKDEVLRNIAGAVPVDGIPTDLAQKTLPDSYDEQIHQKVTTSIKEFVAKKAGGDDIPDDFCLSKLHLYLDADSVDECSNYVNRQLKLDMMRWAYHVCANRLGFESGFYVDKEIYVRINYPFDEAIKGTSSKTTHPSHRLTRYNRGRPKQTWGHGPHKDSWYGHSHSALNFWFSIAGTNIASTMNLFPDHAYRATGFDADSMYASYSEKLTNSVPLALSPCENFIFDPELLHSTRINTSDETRIVLTIRVSEDEPYFSNSIEHDIYDEWVASSSIEDGSLKSEKVGQLVEIEDYPSSDSAVDHIVIRINESRSVEASELNRDDFDVDDGVVFEVNFLDGACLAVWDKGQLFRFSKYCPHVGAPLVGGLYDSENAMIKCPAHGAEFCVKSGGCGAKSLRLRTFG